MSSLSDDSFMWSIAVVLFLINAFGTLGSLLSFYIFTRKPFQNSAFRIYFKSLACLDTCLIFYTGFFLFSLILDKDLINNVNVICKLFYVVILSTSPNPGWVLVLYSIDQLIRVSMSKRFTFVKSKPFQLKFIIGQSIFHLLSSFYVIKQVEVKPVDMGNNVTSMLCEYPISSRLPIMFYVESAFIPFIIMLVTTILILKYMYRSKNTIRKYSTTSNENNLLNGGGGGDIKPNVTVTSKIRDVRFAFNSIVFNVIFVVLNLPSVSVHLYKGEYYNHLIFLRIKSICFVLFCTNFSIHFWIHFFVNAIFRREVYKLLRISK